MTYEARGHIRKYVQLLPLIIFSILAPGCSSTPKKPPEPEISVALKGTAVEVQYFIEERLRDNPESGFQVESATDREIVFKTHCMNVPTMNSFKCSMLMMGIGNSGWDGPFYVMTFRTAEIRGVVNLTAAAKWCAINAFGKSNCVDNNSNAERNELLRKIESSYNKEVVSLDDDQTNQP